MPQNPHHLTVIILSGIIRPNRIPATLLSREVEGPALRNLGNQVSQVRSDRQMVALSTQRPPRFEDEID
jgi:hypothetical protein